MASLCKPPYFDSQTRKEAWSGARAASCLFVLAGSVHLLSRQKKLRITARAWEMRQRAKCASMASEVLNNDPDAILLTHEFKTRARARLEASMFSDWEKQYVSRALEAYFASAPAARDVAYLNYTNCLDAIRVANRPKHLPEAVLWVALGALGITIATINLGH